MQGVHIYRMRRTVGDRVLGYNLAVSQHERTHERHLVVRRLREARRHLQRMVSRELVRGAARALMRAKRERARAAAGALS